MAAAVRRAPLLHTSRHTSCTCTRAPLALPGKRTGASAAEGSTAPRGGVRLPIFCESDGRDLCLFRECILHTTCAHTVPALCRLCRWIRCMPSSRHNSSTPSFPRGRPSQPPAAGPAGATRWGDAEGVLQNGGHPAQLPAVVLVRRLHLRPCAPARAHHLAGCETARWPTAWHCVARVGILIQLLDKDRLIVSANGAGPCRASHETGCHCSARASRWPADHIL